MRGRAQSIDDQIDELGDEMVRFTYTMCSAWLIFLMWLLCYGDKRRIA